MNRSVTALLILASVSFATETAAFAKDTVAVKRPNIFKQLIKPTSFFRRDEVKAASGEPRMIVREESAVVSRDQQYAVPQGALYTSSDECG